MKFSNATSAERGGSATDGLGLCGNSCPVSRAARVIDGKWTTLIVRDLLQGKKRYSELMHSLEGISPKVLASRLRFLEQEGLVTKTIYPEVPPHTEYQLTKRGLQLQTVIAAMAEFGMQLRSGAAQQ